MEAGMIGRHLGALLVIVVLTIGVCGGKRLPVDEVSKKHLDVLMQTEDYLAVFWSKLNTSRDK